MTLAEATAELARHTGAATALREHRLLSRAHAANEPQPPRGERPATPEHARPSADNLADASRRVALAERAIGQQEAAQRAVADADREEAACTTRAADAAAEAAREARYVVVLRGAPLAQLRKQISALPEMPHVRVTVPDDGDRLTIEGQTIRGEWVDALCLSTGERLRAGAEMRHAIRSAADAKLGTWASVPLPIDDRGTWTGEIDITGPVVEFHTEAATE